MPEAFWAHVAASSEATRRAAETATTSSSGADADHDAFVALYVIEGDPQWDFARAAGGLIVHTRPEAHLDSAPAPLPRLVILRGVNQFNNSENRLSDSWGGDSRTRFARSCDIPGIVARPAVHFRATEAVVVEDDHHGGIHHHEELPSSEKDDSGNVPSGTSSIGSGIGCGWSVFRTDRISRDEKLGATDVCTALAILRPRRYRLRKMDVRLCRAALRRRRRVQYATLSPAWARRSELFRLADAVWSFNENVSADRSSGGSSNVHYDDKANDASTTKKKRKKEMTYVAPLLETSVVRSTAAVAIQSLWRGYRVRDVAGASIAARIVRHRAATVMQRWWRVRLLSRRCLMLGQLRALLANTRGEAHLCLSEESVRRLATFNKATTSRASPVPESKIRYCFHLATGGVVGVMGQTDALYKRQSAVAEWTGISVDLITEAEATNKDNEFSPIYTRENVEPLLKSFVAHTFGSDDEDEDDDDEGGAAATSVPRSPERAESRSGAGVDRKRRLARARSRSDGYSGSTGSGPHLFHFSDSIEARRRVALLFLLTWDVYTMRGVELSVHPDLHTYRMRHARRLQSRKTSRATDNTAMASSSMLRADGREDSTTLHREETTTSTATAVATGMPGDERSVTFINNQQGRGLDAATRGGGMTSTAARDYGAGLGRSGSGMYCWRDGWLTPESAGAVADFEASMKDLTGLNRNISRIRADAVASPGVASTKDDLVRQRKEQALNLKEDLQRQRRAREEFDEREEQIRKAMINKVLTPSVIVRSPNTSSATFKHYMNDPPMLQMRARQLEKAELVRKKVLVESMQSSSQSRRLVRDRAIAQARADARNHVYSMRSVHSEAIAQRRHAEQLENSRRVAFRDWERRQLQDKMMNVAHAKELSSRLSSLGLSMQRAITNARRETMLLATASATRCQSEAERRVISMRRSMRSSYGLVRRPRRRMARSSSADRQLGSKSACGGRNVGFDIDDDDDDDDGDGVGMEGMDCGSASSGEDVDGNGGGGDQDSCGGGGGTRGPARGRTAGATKSTTRGERMSWTTSSSASDRHHRDAHPAALSGRASAQPWHAPRRAHDGGKADNLGAAYQHDGVTKGAAMKKKSATTTTTTTTSRTSGEMRNSGFEIAVGIRTSQRTMCGDRRRASSGLGFSSSTTPPPISSMASPFGTRRHAVKMAKVMGTHDAERVRSDDTTSRPSPPSRLPLNCHRSPP